MSITGDMIPVMNRFGDALQMAMAGETQSALARRTGLSQASISRYLTSDRQPTMRHLDVLEYALPSLRDLRTNGSASGSSSVVSGRVA